MRRFLAAVMLATLAFAGSAHATMLTDGSLSIDITSDGRFDVISLNGTAIDTSSFVQQQYINGSTIGSGSTVVVSGPSATYTGLVGAFQISVTSTILGPSSGNLSSSIFRQSFAITNTSGSSASLESVSFLDPDVGDTVSNLTQYDPTTNSVYATAPSVPGRLIATTADTNDGAFAFHNATLGTLGLGIFANLNGSVGPVGISDIEHAVGLNFGLLGAGQTTTLDFEYLFATNLTAPDPNWNQTAVPEPTSLALLGMGVAGLGGYRLRRKRHQAA